MRVAVGKERLADDLAAIGDEERFVQVEIRSGRYEGVEIDGRVAVLPEDGSERPSPLKAKDWPTI